MFNSCRGLRFFLCPMLARDMLITSFLMDSTVSCDVTERDQLFSRPHFPTRTTGRERTPGDLAGVARDKTPLNLHFFSFITTGGVRGVGFVHSPLFTYGPRTAMELMHVTDWLPTLYYAAGGNISDLQNIDGVNMWDALTQATESPRQVILHNIDPFSGAAAIRYRNWKLLVNICEQTENYIYNIL